MLTTHSLSAALLISAALLSSDVLSVQAQQSLPLNLEGSDRAPRLSSSEYVLGPGDQVNVSVLSYEEYDGVREILPDGTIGLPSIGSVEAAGHTLTSLSAELAEQLSNWVTYPVVSVTLEQQRPVIVDITGAVRRPGPTRLVENSSSLSAAIAAAGGVGRNANIREVQVSRTLSDGRQSTATVDLWRSVWSEEFDEPSASASERHTVVLRDGDAIFVPQVSDANELDERIVAQSSLAPETVSVRVVGEVLSPGEVEVAPNSTVSRAIASAGGPTNDAALRRVEFVRLNDSGEVTSRNIDLRRLVDEVQVQEGDVVIVPERNSSSLLDIAVRILNPFSTVINILEDL